jgi:MFS family permease
MIAYMLAMQVGLEAQGVAMPQLTENAFKDFSILPLVMVFASIGSMIGQPMTKFFTERFSLAKTFYAAHALRAISLGTMVLLFGTNLMSMPLMMGFYLLNGIVTGIALTAEGTLRKLILAQKGISQQSYRTWWQLLAEILAVPTPIFFGVMVHSLGAVGAPLVTAIYPVSILLGLMLAFILKVYPLKDIKKVSDEVSKNAAQAAPVEQQTPTEQPAPARKGTWNSIRETASKIFVNMEEGKNYVMGTPYLKYSLVAATVFDLFNIVIYRLIAPAYGKMTGGEAGLSAVQGNMVGMFSLGGLLLSVVFLTLENIAKARAKRNSASPELAAADERSSMLRWTLAGIPALALLATMALHVALPLAPLVFLGINWIPASLLAAALIPFGFFQVAASIKLNSYFQEKLPQDAAKVQKALAFSGSVMTAVSIVTILILRPLFSDVTVFNPFPWLTVALLAIGVGLFFLQRKLASATKPEAIAAAQEIQKQREASQGQSPRAGAYVGLILGIVATAVVITALPIIPGVAGFIAGLSVSAKFGINLVLTVTIPLAGYWIGQSKSRSQ